MKKEMADPSHFLKRLFSELPSAFGTCHSLANRPRHQSYGKSQILTTPKATKRVKFRQLRPLSIEKRVAKNAIQELIGLAIDNKCKNKVKKVAMFDVINSSSAATFTLSKI